MRTKAVVHAFACCATWVALTVGVAVADTPRSAVLTGNADVIATPGIGKILLAFVLTLAVGVALILALRRVLPWLPKLVGQTSQADTPRILGSRNLHAGLKLHVVEAEGTTVLVAEGRGGIAMTVLPPRLSAASPSTDVNQDQQAFRNRES